MGLKSLQMWTTFWLRMPAPALGLLQSRWSSEVDTGFARHPVLMSVPLELWFLERCPKHHWSSRNDIRREENADSERQAIDTGTVELEVSVNQRNTRDDTVTVTYFTYHHTAGNGSDWTCWDPHIPPSWIIALCKLWGKSHHASRIPEKRSTQHTYPSLVW